MKLIALILKTEGADKLALINVFYDFSLVHKNIILSFSVIY